MMGEINRLIGVVMVALACVCMWGCGDLLREDGEKEFTGHYIKGNANVIGFIDDSLVIVYDFQYWNQDLADGSQITGAGKQRLRVFNYRVQEDGPRWADTLDNMTEVYDYVKGQLSDSVIWGGNGRTSFSFWKLGEEPVVRGVRVNKEGCDMDYGVRSLRPWLNETIIALGENSLKNSGSACQYAILDTIANTLTYKRLDANLKWIEKCDDVRARGDDVYCVILDDEGENSVVLKNENDTIPAPRKFAIGGFWGDMIKMSGNICNIKNDKITCSDVVWYGNELKFYQNGEIIVDLN
jgi:hypothetical protein